MLCRIMLLTGNVWREKTIIKNIKITELNLDEELNEFKKVDRNLRKDWTWKINAILKEVKSDDITEID